MIRECNDIVKVGVRKWVVVPKLRRVVSRFSTQWYEFDPMAIYVGFEVGEVAVG